MQSGISPNDLRRRAEETLKGNPLEMGGLSTQDIQFIIHELQVHQVELQLQNEELRRLQLELEISRDNFSNLYDFAPVCYCTLDRKGMIREANQMSSEILGVKKGELIGQSLAHFVYRDDQDDFYIHHRHTLKTREKQRSEIRIVAADGAIHYVQIQSAASDEQGNQIRVILTDITERKKIEQTIRENEANLAQRVRELDALHEAISSLLSTLDTSALLSQMIESALKAIPAARMGLIYLVHPGYKSLRISAFALSPDAKQKHLAFSNRGRYVTRVLSTKQSLSLPNIKIQIEKNETDPVEVHKTKSALMVPLITEDQTFGVMSLESPEVGAFTDAEMNLLGSFATTATAALRNARLHEQLQKISNTDFLTKVYNRQGFFEIGQHEYLRFLRSARPLSLILLDIDKFKEINDTFGHPTGDQVLILLGQRLMGQLRKADVLGRYGGDEFVVLLPETDLDTAVKIATRLNRAVGENPIQMDNQLIQITISQGVSQATKALPDLDSLVKQADNALYLAKAVGPNRIQAAK